MTKREDFGTISGEERDGTMATARLKMGNWTKEKVSSALDNMCGTEKLLLRIVSERITGDEQLRLLALAISSNSKGRMLLMEAIYGNDEQDLLI